MIHEDSSLLAEAQEAQVNSLIGAGPQAPQLEDYMRQHPGGRERGGTPRAAYRGSGAAEGSAQKKQGHRHGVFNRLARGEAA